MPNINLQKQRSLSYSEVFFNEKEIKTITSYHTVLQSRVNYVSELILAGYKQLINFSESYFDKHKEFSLTSEEDSVFSDITMEYIDVLKNGIPLLSTASHQLGEKEIDRKTFEFLLKIINYQIDTTKELLRKELTIERIEVVFNHLKDVPYYLKTDLELDSLPNLKSAVIKKSKKPEDSGWKIIKQKYNPNNKVYIA